MKNETTRQDQRKKWEVICGKKSDEYSQLLKDPRWQKLRLQVFERDKFTCQSCFSEAKTLAVHHKYYRHPRPRPWEYKLHELMTLCEECHARDREERQKAETRLSLALKKKGFLSTDLDTLAGAIEKMNLEDAPTFVASAFAWALETPEIQNRLLNDFFSSIP
jgi:hypothetical protein